jgi:hypothetical protein
MGGALLIAAAMLILGAMCSGLQLSPAVERQAIAANLMRDINVLASDEIRRARTRQTARNAGQSAYLINRCNPLG